MSKAGLWIVIGTAAFVVVTLAVLTPTVIVGNDHGGVRVLPASAPTPAPTPAPSPFRRGFLPDLRNLRNLRQCFEQHGFGGPEHKLPTPDQFRGAFRDCAPRLR